MVNDDQSGLNFVMPILEIDLKLSPINHNLFVDFVRFMRNNICVHFHHNMLSKKILNLYFWWHVRRQCILLIWPAPKKKKVGRHWSKIRLFGFCFYFVLFFFFWSTSSQLPHRRTCARIEMIKKNNSTQKKTSRRLKSSSRPWWSQRRSSSKALSTTSANSPAINYTTGTWSTRRVPCNCGPHWSVSLRLIRSTGLRRSDRVTASTLHSYGIVFEMVRTRSKTTKKFLEPVIIVATTFKNREKQWMNLFYFYEHKQKSQ